MSIIAAQAHMRPHLPLTTLAAELRDLGLAALGSTDITVSLPTVLSWSLRTLTPDQTTAFALLGTAPGPDISLPAASSLTGFPLATTRTVLRGLEQASLIYHDLHGRYRIHDLVRQYAATLPASDGDAAQRRLIDHGVDPL
ncbi:hypothetical protein [Saccharothrix texasensis]|uniref:hypothetical protein n=1 Tax=Saccharothrix texasensis TaxID=103734 RepID=UPI0011CDE447|nr:hypothetical protein [Saccharothrix texasensis]